MGISMNFAGLALKRREARNPTWRKEIPSRTIGQEWEDGESDMSTGFNIAKSTRNVVKRPLPPHSPQTWTVVIRV